MDNNEEILQRMEKRLIDLEDRAKKVRTTNIIIWVCIAALIIAAAIVLTPKINTFIEGYNNSLVIVDDIVKSLDGVDIESLSETLRTIGEIDTEKVKSLVTAINDISGALDQLKDFFA